MCCCTVLQKGFQRLAEAAIPNIPNMEPQQVTDLVVALHKYVTGAAIKAQYKLYTYMHWNIYEACVG